MDGSVRKPLQPAEILFFMHIMKTAGTTLFHIIRQHYADDEILRSAVQIGKHRDFFDPEMAREYRLIWGHYSSKVLDMLPEVVPITMFRNPIDRTISHYEFECRHRGGQFQQNFPELRDYVVKARSGWHNLHTRQVGWYLWQPDPPLPDDDELLERAKRNLDTFRFVGLVESFDESLMLLCYILGWDYPADYEIKRQSPRKRWKSEGIDDETLELIYEGNKLDFQLYEYAKERYQRDFQAMAQDMLALRNTQNA